jgi:hypothetical protein
MCPSVVCKILFDFGSGTDLQSLWSDDQYLNILNFFLRRLVSIMRCEG